MLNSPSKSSSGSVQAIVDLFLTAAMFVAVGLLIWRNWPSPPPPPIPIPEEPITLSDAVVRGDPRASVVLVEYSDFECRYCGRFARETLPQIDEIYLATGKVQLVYLHLAPPGHSRATPAAVAAECAGRQGVFWAMHDRLFSDQSRLADEDLTAHALALGIDSAAFRECQADSALAQRVARDTSQALALRISGTPAFFVGRLQPDGRVRITQSLRGAVPLTVMQKALDAELGGSLGGKLRRLDVRLALAAMGATGCGLLWGLVRAAHRRRTAPHAGT